MNDRAVAHHGALWVVATPIGNLDDISARAAAALGRADVIACEDTRRTSSLLRHLGIDRPELVVLNDHSERRVLDRLVGDLAAGRCVVLVSDAGMPAVSDPGWLLVRAVIAAGMEVDVLPGPVAAVVAVVASGLPTDRFCVEGFLPRKGSGRRARLLGLGTEPRTSVLYEAPHRLAETLADLAALGAPDRAVCVARELTKLHQELWRGTVADAAVHFGANPVRGEVVIVLAGASESEVSDVDLVDALRRELDAGATRRSAVDAVAAAFGVPRRRVYELSVQ